MFTCEPGEPMRHRDPLVALWRDTSRPLNWQAWVGLSDADAATLRYALMKELQTVDAWSPSQAWAWVHVHREILELKAASGHGVLLSNELSGV